MLLQASLQHWLQSEVCPNGLHLVISTKMDVNVSGWKAAGTVLASKLLKQEKKLCVSRASHTSDAARDTSIASTATGLWMFLAGLMTETKLVYAHCWMRHAMTSCTCVLAPQAPPCSCVVNFLKRIVSAIVGSTHLQTCVHGK